jgi:hypothetical protein
MIKQCQDNNVYLEILDKLKEVKNCKITSKILYTYMISEKINKSAMTLVSYDKDIMNGCVVLKIIRDDFGELSFFMTFIWIDAHFPKLLKEFIDFGNNKAKELNIKKIIFSTGRKENIIERRMSKYGFKKISITYAKEVI